MLSGLRTAQMLDEDVRASRTSFSGKRGCGSAAAQLERPDESPCMPPCFSRAWRLCSENMHVKTRPKEVVRASLQHCVRHFSLQNTRQRVPRYALAELVRTY